MSEDRSYSLIGYGTDGKPPLPEAPADMAGKLTWLKAMSEEEDRLKKIEREFKATSNPLLLKEFTPPDDAFTVCKLMDDHFEGPIALVDPRGSYGKKLQKHHEDIKRMFPDIKTEEVTTTTGRRIIAYIGVDTEILGCAANLVEKEAIVREAIEEQSKKIVAGHKSQSANDGILKPGPTIGQRRKSNVPTPG